VVTTGGGGAAAIAAAALLAAAAAEGAGRPAACCDWTMDDSSAPRSQSATVEEEGVGYPDPSWESFTIPDRPRGQTLRIVILSTWGDPHYVVIPKPYTLNPEP
jgi:hypothetical protein